MFMKPFLPFRGVTGRPVVSAVDPAALRDAQRAVAELHDQPQLHLVMNRVQPRLIRRLRTSIDNAMDAAGLPLLGVVPEDPAVTLSCCRGSSARCS